MTRPVGMLVMLTALTIWCVSINVTFAQNENPLGSESNPVKTNGRDAQSEYIESLDCDNGAVREFKYMGKAGWGPHGNELDRYVLRCEGIPELFEVFMDAHHEENETEIIKGFVSWL